LKCEYNSIVGECRTAFQRILDRKQASSYYISNKTYSLSIIHCPLLLTKEPQPKGWRMGSSSPQEGGTTDEDYYGQPQQMPIIVCRSPPQKPPQKLILYIAYN
jgi:hypothetical protein